MTCIVWMYPVRHVFLTDNRNLRLQSGAGKQIQNRNRIILCHFTNDRNIAMQGSDIFFLFAVSSRIIFIVSMQRRNHRYF